MEPQEKEWAYIPSIHSTLVFQITSGQFSADPKIQTYYLVHPVTTCKEQITTKISINALLYKGIPQTIQNAIEQSQQMFKIKRPIRKCDSIVSTYIVKDSKSLWNKFCNEKYFKFQRALLNFLNWAFCIHQNYFIFL